MRLMAVIRNPRFGVNERRLGRVGLTLETWVHDDYHQAHFFDPDEAAALVRQFEVNDIDELDGRLVWVLVASDLLVIDRPCYA